MAIHFLIKFLIPVHLPSYNFCHQNKTNCRIHYVQVFFQEKSPPVAAFLISYAFSPLFCYPRHHPALSFPWISLWKYYFHPSLLCQADSHDILSLDSFAVLNNRHLQNSMMAKHLLHHNPHLYLHIRYNATQSYHHPRNFRPSP